MSDRANDRRRADGPAEGEAATRRSAPKRAWSKPELTALGSLRDLVRGGAGKLTSQFDGDGRKPAGMG